MEMAKVRTEEQVLLGKMENLIAIGADTAANCIPCFGTFMKKPSLLVLH